MHPITNFVKNICEGYVTYRGLKFVTGIVHELGHLGGGKLLYGEDYSIIGFSIDKSFFGWMNDSIQVSISNNIVWKTNIMYLAGPLVGIIFTYYCYRRIQKLKNSRIMTIITKGFLFCNLFGELCNLLPLLESSDGSRVFGFTISPVVSYPLMLIIPAIASNYYLF